MKTIDTLLPAFGLSWSLRHPVPTGTSLTGGVHRRSGDIVVVLHSRDSMGILSDFVHTVDPADGVIHNRICRTLTSWRALVTLAVSTRKRGFSGFPPPPRLPGFAARHKKSTLCAHQMAVPGQRRTENPR